MATEMLQWTKENKDKQKRKRKKNKECNLKYDVLLIIFTSTNIYTTVIFCCCCFFFSYHTMESSYMYDTITSDNATTVNGSKIIVLI